MRLLQEVLEQDFDLDLAGWTEFGVSDISDDGFTIVGAGKNPVGQTEAWVAIAGTNDAGEPVVNVTTLDGFHGDNQPRAQGFWEWETNRVVSQSGNMVHVWSSYASARTEGGEPYNGGVNSITLFHDGTRWWVMGWMFDSAAGPLPS